jgi:hypothetical protein
VSLLKQLYVSVKHKIVQFEEKYVCFIFTQIPKSQSGINFGSKVITILKKVV